MCPDKRQHDPTMDPEYNDIEKDDRVTVHRRTVKVPDPESGKMVDQLIERQVKKMPPPTSWSVGNPAMGQFNTRHPRMSSRGGGARKKKSTKKSTEKKSSSKSSAKKKERTRGADGKFE